MNIDTLQTFVDVARLGSFAAAARAADTDPSVVSRANAGLETELGFRLFQRTTRTLTLTEAGAQYLARIEAVVDELARAGDDALALSTAPRGTLRMTASVAFGQELLVPHIPEFHRRYPEITLELNLADENIDLVAETMDLAIRLAPAIEADLVCTKLVETRYRVCATREYLETAGPISEPRDLEERPALLFTLPDFRRRWLFRDRGGAVEEVPVSGTIVMSSALALRDCMLSGLGPALLADWLVDTAIADSRCVDLFPDHQVTATSFDTAAWIVYPSRRFVPHKVRVMIDFLKSRLRWQ